MSTQTDERRLGRMREVWQDAAPSKVEIAAARRRYVERTHAIKGRSFLPDLLGSIAVASAVVLALTWEEWGGSSATSTDGGSSVVVANSGREGAGREGAGQDRPTSSATAVSDRRPDPVTTPSAPRIESSAGSIVASPGVEYSVAAGESVTVVVGGERTVVRGPKLIEFTLDTAQVSGFRMHLSEPSSGVQAAPAEQTGAAPGQSRTALTPSVKIDGVHSMGASDDGRPRSVTGSSVPSSGGASSGDRNSASQQRGGAADQVQSQTGDGATVKAGANGQATQSGRGTGAQGEVATTEGAWSRVAEAMRRGDQGRAERELVELSRGAAQQGRDAAALALAQLWIADGQLERARPVLERLSQQGQTALVRRRARELLQR